MANITETELRRKLRAAATTGGGGTSGPTAVRDGDTWSYSEDVLYLIYATAITNISSSGTIVNQSDAAGLQYEAFSSTGALLPWRGYLFSKSIYASGDPTDYIWEDISGSISGGSTMERYYSTYSGLLSEMGNPDYPGQTSGGSTVPWTSIPTTTAIPDTAFFIAERYTINSVKSTWNVYAVATEENGFGLIPYTITGRNKPALNSTQWNDDTILAVSAFTGRAYSVIKEFGYGTTVVITYDDGKLYGMLKKVNGVATWVAPVNYIDGALLVDTSIISGKIADNAITTNKILNDAINSDKIAANAVNTSEIAAGAITANEIQANTIGANQIAANTITAGEIAANAITTSELAAGAVTANEIVANTISANEMKAGSVTTTVLAANAVNADKIAANAITASKLLVTGTGAVTPGTIGAGTIASVTAAQSTADGKIVSFYQATAPTAGTIGDLWTDTDTWQQYRWNGTSWITLNILLPEGVAGAINDNTTTIEGSKITTGTILANRLHANGINAAQITSGTIDTNRLSLTAGDVGAGSNATSGSRMVITSDSIKIYDGAVLRVTIGNLA